MAKPLGPKSILIRNAITANPEKQNTELAKMLMGAAERKADKIKITAQDVAAQRQALKKPGAAKTTAEPASKPARKKPGRKPAIAPVAPRPPSAPAISNPVDLIDKAFSLAQECGGVDQLKRLVDRIAGMQQG